MLYHDITRPDMLTTVTVNSYSLRAEDSTTHLWRSTITWEFWTNLQGKSRITSCQWWHSILSRNKYDGHAESRTAVVQKPVGGSHETNGCCRQVLKRLTNHSALKPTPKVNWQQSAAHLYHAYIWSQKCKFSNKLQPHKLNPTSQHIKHSFYLFFRKHDIRNFPAHCLQ